MGKKNNIVFNLTIDDLKELGIIKRKRQRRKTPQRIMKYIQQPNNIKSVSDHMTGYSNVFNNANTSNLQTENLRLQNEVLNDTSKLKIDNLRLQNNLLENYPMIESDYTENRFKTIEDANKKLNVWTNHLLSTTYRPAIKTNYDDEFPSGRVEQLDDPNNIVHNDDNVDVAGTGGSDDFKAQEDETPQIVVKSPQQEDVQLPSLPVVQQTGIRSPFDMLKSITKIRRDKQIVPVNGDDISESIHNMANKTPPPNNYRLRDDASDFPEITKENLETHNKTQKKITNEHQETQYRVRQNNIQEAINEYKALGGNNEEILNSDKLRVIRKEITIKKAINEYKSLGGNKDEILSSDEVLPITKEILLLQDALKPKKGKQK
jgi:hypothetical protein